MPRCCPLPSVNGISARYVVLTGSVPDDGVAYVAGRSGDSGYSFGQPLVPGTVLPRPTPAWFHPVVDEEKPIPFDYTIVDEDERLIVVDKPHFLPVTSNGRLVVNTVQTRLRRQFQCGDISPLHRLDRLTAGIVVSSRDPATRGQYAALFARRAVTKTYVARLQSDPPVGPQWTTIRCRMRKPRGARAVVLDPSGTETVTHICRLDDRVVAMRPVTGHTHQLRVVAFALGCPIAGEDTYGCDKKLDLYDFSSPLSLVAASLSLTDPITQCLRSWRSDHPLARAYVEAGTPDRLGF